MKVIVQKKSCSALAEKEYGYGQINYNLLLVALKGLNLKGKKSSKKNIFLLKYHKGHDFD